MFPLCTYLLNKKTPSITYIFTIKYLNYGKRKKFRPSKIYAMFKNYCRTAFRNLAKRKGFTLLNIAGLAIGIACCLLLFQYVSYERSYDSYADGQPLYRVRTDSYGDGKLGWQAATSYPITGPHLKKDYPEVEDFCRLIKAELLLGNDAKQAKFAENKGYYADASCINLLNVQLLKGNAGNALSGTDKMVVSSAMAKKYFGDDDAIGKMLTVRSNHTVQHYQVSGVFKDYPANSHLNIQYLISYATLGKVKRLQGDTTNSTETMWGWYDFYTYVKLKPGAGYKKLEAKMPEFCRRYFPDLNWAKANNAWDELHFIPVKDIHLYSNYFQEAEVNGNAGSVNFMFLIALVILGIAWINYINLATARSVERAREVGVRKVLGARRSSLVKQFLAESLLLNIAALLLAFIAALALTPLFNGFVGHGQAPALFNMQGIYWSLFASLFTAGTLLSGLYPAFVLSGYQPVTVLKGMFKNAAGGLALRKGLIVLQFVTSIILIGGTIIVYQQVQYMQRQNLGFNINQTLVLNGAGTLSDSLYNGMYTSFKTDLQRLPAVQSVTASSGIMGKEIDSTNDLKRIAPKGGYDKTFTCYNLGIDYDFIPAYQLKLIAGRNFSKDFPSDRKAAILNETALNMLHFSTPQEALNTKVLEAGFDTLTVVGVMADFHHLGLQKSVDPQIFFCEPATRMNYSIKLSSPNMPLAIEGVKKVWSTYFPNDPFNYFFLDDYYNEQYKASNLFGRVFGIFAALAILIACFGLSGLSAYNILQRTKEIGVRKVMGASVKQLLYILSKDFILLVLIAFIIAAPVCWWAMSGWLNDFAYRISIQVWVFAVAGLLAGTIALATICLQAIKAATANPVGALRSE